MTAFKPSLIHELMHTFNGIPGAVVGHGPKHPTAPNVSIAPDIRTFLEQYLFLQQDHGYVTFLESYAGAHILQPDGALSIDLFGFLSISTHMTEYEDPIIDTEGYLTFCTISVRAAQDLAYSFDSTLSRPWGIYETSTTPQLLSTTRWYCSSFTDWLRQVINTYGRPSISF
jgi:hypothetical protein